MPSPTLRYAGHSALERLEWIERHVSARPNTREVREKLVGEIEDLRHLIVTKMIGGYSERGSRRTPPCKTLEPRRRKSAAEKRRTLAVLPGQLDIPFQSPDLAESQSRGA